MHLAPAKNSVVGKRAGVDTLVEVSGDILADLETPVYQAPNGVILIESVPVAAVISIHNLKQAGRGEVERVAHRGPQ